MRLFILLVNIEDFVKIVIELEILVESFEKLLVLICSIFLNL